MANDFVQGALASQEVQKSKGNPFQVLSTKIQEAQARRYAEDQQRNKEVAELQNAISLLSFQEIYKEQLAKITAEEERKTLLLKGISEGKITETSDTGEGTLEGTPFGVLNKRYKLRNADVSPTQLLTEGGEPPEGYEIVGYDQRGQPMIRKIKLSSSQEKRKVEVEELKGQIKNLTDLFSQAQQEMSGISGAGKKGIEGRLAGVFGITKGKAGYSPAVNVYNDKRKAFATTVAKAAGEVRPTDQDIVRFMGTLPDLKKNDEENAIIINQLEKDLESKDAGIVWKERAKTNKKQGGQIMIDAQGNKAMVYPDGSFEEIK